MTPLKILKDAVGAFETLGQSYCLVGGHAASLYRTQERVTRDVDFALVAKPAADSKRVAELVIAGMGLKPVVGFIPPEAHKPMRQSVCMVTSAPLPGELTGIIDILLPELPWVAQAVERAQYNRINLSFALVPVIPPEDLIVAKCFAVKNSPDRFQDLDDLKEIFIAVTDLDHQYLRHSLSAFGVSVPEAVVKFAPAGLK